MSPLRHRRLEGAHRRNTSMTSAPGVPMWCQPPPSRPFRSSVPAVHPRVGSRPQQSATRVVQAGVQSAPQPLQHSPYHSPPHSPTPPLVRTKPRKRISGASPPPQQSSPALASLSRSPCVERHRGLEAVNSPDRGPPQSERALVEDRTSAAEEAIEKVETAIEASRKLLFGGCPDDSAAVAQRPELSISISSNEKRRCDEATHHAVDYTRHLASPEACRPHSAAEAGCLVSAMREECTKTLREEVHAILESFGLEKEEGRQVSDLWQAVQETREELDSLKKWKERSQDKVDCMERVQDDLNLLQRQRRELAAKLDVRLSDVQELRDSQAVLKESVGKVEALGRKIFGEQRNRIEEAFEGVQRDLDEVRDQHEKLAKVVEALAHESREAGGLSSNLDEKTSALAQELQAAQSLFSTDIELLQGQQDELQQKIEKQYRSDLAILQNQNLIDMNLMRAQWHNDVELLRCLSSRSNESIEALWRLVNESDRSSERYAGTGEPVQQEDLATSRSLGGGNRFVLEGRCDLPDAGGAPASGEACPEWRGPTSRMTMPRLSLGSGRSDLKCDLGMYNKANDQIQPESGSYRLMNAMSFKASSGTTTGISSECTSGRDSVQGDSDAPVGSTSSYPESTVI